MVGLRLDAPDGALEVLCLGAHADDIEIGCGGTLLRLAAEYPRLSVHWVVFSGVEERAEEARHAAELFLRGAHRAEVVIHRFRDGFFPYEGADIKEVFEELRSRVSPGVIFTHRGEDRHQDHRVLSELTWNSFRDHLILEYEIPKYDGDLGAPNLFVALDEATRDAKVRHLMEAFATQRSKRWFSPETFLGLMRLRGVECASPTGYAEGFHARKTALVL
jgi:LmbE family N-acetylglucosaminyl deacetylase